MYLQNLCDILKVVKGTIICIENGERKEYESGAEALKAYSKYYGVVGLSAENDCIVIEIKDQKPDIDKSKEAFIKDHVEKYGAEPNLFDGV